MAAKKALGWINFIGELELHATRVFARAIFTNNGIADDGDGGGRSSRQGLDRITPLMIVDKHPYKE